MQMRVSTNKMKNVNLSARKMATVPILLNAAEMGADEFVYHKNLVGTSC